MFQLSKKGRTTLLSLLIAATSSAQSPAVDAAIAKFQRFYNAQQPDSVYEMFATRVKSSMSEEKNRAVFVQLYGSFGTLDKYEFSKQNVQASQYKCVFAKNTLTLVVAVNADNKIETFRFIPYHEDTVKTNFTYKSPTGSIYGTLTTPPGSNRVPVVLIIAGSGPTDRNCNQPGMTTNAYAMLADSLNKRGIASLRYDKRGVGESTLPGKGEEALSFDDMVSDARGIIEMLQSDGRFSKVIVLGHSEGSLIGMIAAAAENSSGFVSLAGAAERADYLVVKQMEAQSADMSKKARKNFDSLLKGFTVTPSEPGLASIFRPSVQPYLRSWLKYDPAKEIKKLNQPVLILQGTTDIQVDVAQAEKLKKANKRAQLVLIPGMNHVLKTAPADRMMNIATYNDPNLLLSPGLVPAIATFIQQQ